MDRHARKRLHDALQAVEEILEITKDLTFQDFVGDVVRKKAVYYDFAVLGEALGKLGKMAHVDPSLLSGRRAAIDMRNRLSHCGSRSCLVHD